MPLSKLRAYLVILPLIVLTTFVMGSLSMIASVFDRSGRTQHAIARKWARMLLMIGSVTTRVEGLEKLKPGNSYVFVANHRSFVDTPAVLALIPFQFRFFAKKSLFRIPMIGGHLRRAGHFPVERENPRASLKSLSEGARLVNERGVSVLLFPEGGRTEPDEPMREFQEGASYLAIKAGVPVVPIGIIGTAEVMPMGSLHVHPGPIALLLGDPISTSGMTPHDRSTLTGQIRDQIVQMVGTYGQTTARAIPSR